MSVLSDLIPAGARKAVYAAVGFLSLLAAIPDLLPAGWAAKTVAVLAALSSALAVGNVAPKDQAGGDPPAGPDRGDIGLSVLFHIVALVAFLIFMAIGFDWITSKYLFGWLGLGLAAWVLAELVP